MERSRGQRAPLAACILLCLFCFASANLYGFGKIDGMPLGLSFSKLGGYFESMTFGTVFPAITQQRDSPFRAALTNRAVYTISENGRFCVAWGEGYFGNPPAFPQGSNIRTPTRIVWDETRAPGLSRQKFEDVAAPDDGSFVVLLTTQGEIYSFGRNDRGQLGRTTAGFEDIYPAKVNAPTAVSRLFAGDDFVIGLLRNGSLIGWGGNTNGVLGRDPAIVPFSVQPVIIDGASPFVSVAVGAQHVVACAEDGGTYVWGRNQTFELGAAANPAQAASFRWQPIRATTGALSNPDYRCEIPLAGWNATIVIVDRVNTFPRCSGVLFGRGYRNSLPLDTPSLIEDIELVFPTEEPSMCSSTDDTIAIRDFNVIDIAYRGHYGLSLYGQRNVSDASSSRVASWGPTSIGETLDSTTTIISPDSATDFLRGPSTAEYLDELLARRGERGVSKLFVGSTSFIVVTSDNNAYIWGADPRSDTLLTSPAGPSLRLPFADSPIRIDKLGLLTEDELVDQYLGFVREIKTFSPDPTDTFQTTLILSQSLYGDRSQMVVVGDWWDLTTCCQKRSSTRPIYLSVDAGLSLYGYMFAKVYSWAAGSRHIIALSDCDDGSSIYRCLLAAGDPENTYGAMGFDDYYLFSQDLAVGNFLELYPTDETVPAENRISPNSISLLAAGPTSSFAVINGNQLWWWGIFAGVEEWYPVRMPGSVSSGAQILQVSISYRDSGFLVDSAGALFVFGLNSPDGQHTLLCVGSPSIDYVTTLTRVPSSERFVSVATGGPIAIATSVSADMRYSLLACGRADYAGLGEQANATLNGFVSTFTPVGRNLSSISVSVGDGHVLIVHQRSEVSCFGRNDLGQCGQIPSNVVWARQAINDTLAVLRYRRIDLAVASPLASLLVSAARLIPSNSVNFVASSMANSIVLTGVSFSADAQDFDIPLFHPYQTCPALAEELPATIATQLGLRETAQNLYFVLKLDVLTNEGGQRLVTRLALMTGDRAFITTAEQYLTSYLTAKGLTQQSCLFQFYQNSGTEISEASVTFYRTEISDCNSTCAVVPSSSQNLKILGLGFGTDVSTLAVRLVSETSTTIGDCIVIEASENKIVCKTTSALPVGKLYATVFRGNRPTIYIPRLRRSNHNNYLTQIAAVVPAPAITGATSPIPYNVPQLQLAVNNVDGSVRPEDVEVVLQIGDGVRCPVIAVGNGSITCNTTAVNATLFGYRAPLTAQVYRASGPSAPAVVATIVDRPVINRNGASNKIAANSPTVAIIGTDFGSDVSSLSVVLSSSSGQRRSTMNVVAEIISASNTQIILRLPVGTFSSGSSIVATVYLSGAPSEPILIGQVVPAPVLTPNTAYKLAANAPVVTISGLSFSDSASAISIVLDVSGSNMTVPCSPVSASLTRVTCALGEVLRTGFLFAVVTANGGSTSREQIAEVVPTPSIRSSTDAIRTGAVEISVSGEGFNSVDPAANVVEVAYNTQDGSPSASCTVVASRSTSQLLVCTLLSSSVLNVTSSLFARVESFGGRSNWTQIGVVGDVSSIGALTPGSIAAIVVVVTVLLVIVIVGGVLGYRYVSGLRARNMQKVPKEMEYMFNIRASDLQILNKLGEGSFGAVYFGKFKGRHVAIKKLAASVLGQQVADFFREAALMGAVAPHPNVVRTYGMCQELGHFSMVMEFLCGGSLDSFLQELKNEGQELSPLQLFQIVFGIARGMAHLAASRVVHRDLAARNILLDGDHVQPRISDFGFSRVVGEEGAGKTNATVGPIRWMSPENIARQEYSEKSDVWSFGVILFEILEKHEPYMEEDVISVAVAIRDKFRNPINDLTVKPPSYIRKLMEMCFEQDPSDRPSFQEITQYLLEHAPQGFVPPADSIAAAQVNAEKAGEKGPIERKDSSSREQSSSSSSSSSDTTSAKVKNVDELSPPVVSTAKKQPRWSQALPKDRDTLIQTMKNEEEMQPLGTNTATQGYRDVKELKDE